MQPFGRFYLSKSCCGRTMDSWYHVHVCEIWRKPQSHHIILWRNVARTIWTTANVAQMLPKQHVVLRSRLGSARDWLKERTPTMICSHRMNFDYMYLWIWILYIHGKLLPDIIIGINRLCSVSYTHQAFGIFVTVMVFCGSPGTHHKHRRRHGNGRYRRFTNQSHNFIDHKLVQKTFCQKQERGRRENSGHCPGPATEQYLCGL